MELFAWLTCFGLFVIGQLASGSDVSWKQWWTYTGVSGPKYWGIMNLDWQMCEKGKRQSPINIDPARLVYDPYLRRIHIDKDRIAGTLCNTGQSIIFRVDSQARHHIHISGGPLVYKYKFEDLYIHFGFNNSKGSEHRINGDSFPAEIQMYGYNSHLYPNMTLAKLGPNGIVAIAIMVMVDLKGNDEMRILSSRFRQVRYRDDQVNIPHLSLGELLPETFHYMTYEGSTTYPGCWETATWIVMNKPIYITNEELELLRSLMQGDREHPKSRMGNNFRPVMRPHHRTVRTNIDFTNSGGGCPSMHSEKFYAARQWHNFS